ncbi:hypothetical protein PR048_001879 [Dryococelus australis]|uniref:Uncharacterized protein n=1 Tax=Dryococelus australis TaxID=614101 RepID=A0ABQ9IIK5_9NEOP|nr:hypothetical protein PR048_001879 [Dryococelus australis]
MLEQVLTDFQQLLGSEPPPKRKLFRWNKNFQIIQEVADHQREGNNAETSQHLCGKITREVDVGNDAWNWWVYPDQLYAST